MRFQFQAKVIAWIDIICSGIFLFLFLLGAFVILTEPELVKDELEQQGTHEHDDEMNKILSGTVWSRMMLLFPSLAYLVGEIVLGFYLLRAVEQMNYKKLRTWFIVTLTLFIFLVVIFAPALLMVSGKPSGTTLIFTGSNCLFTLYSLWVVRNLRKEIKCNAGSGPEYPPPPVYEASFTNSNYYPTNSDKEFLKI